MKYIKRKVELDKCPICLGAFEKKHVKREKFSWQGKTVIVSDLDVLVCLECEESFYTLESEAKIEMILRK